MSFRNFAVSFIGHLCIRCLKPQFATGDLPPEIDSHSFKNSLDLRIQSIKKLTFSFVLAKWPPAASEGMLFEAMVLIIILQSLAIAWLLGCAMVLRWPRSEPSSSGLADSRSSFGPVRNSRGNAVAQAKRRPDGRLVYRTHTSSDGESAQEASEGEYPNGSPATPVLNLPHSPRTPNWGPSQEEPEEILMAEDVGNGMEVAEEDHEGPVRPIYLRRRCLRQADAEAGRDQHAIPPRRNARRPADEVPLQEQPPGLRQFPLARVMQEHPWPEWRSEPFRLQGMELYIVGSGSCLHLGSCHVLRNRTSGTPRRLYLCRYCIREVPSAAETLLWQGTTLHSAAVDVCPRLDRYQADRKRLCRACWSGRLSDATFQDNMA